MANAWKKYKKERDKKTEESKAVSTKGAQAWAEAKKTMKRPSPAASGQQGGVNGGKQLAATKNQQQAQKAALQKNMTTGAPTASEREKAVVGGSFGNGRNTTKLGGFTGDREREQTASERAAKTLEGAAAGYLGNLASAVGAGVQMSSRNPADRAIEMLMQAVDNDTANDELMQAALAREQERAQRKANTGDALRTLGRDLSGYGQGQIEKAKEDLGAAGKLLVDTGAGGAQLAADIGLGALTGLGMGGVMAVRGFGGGAEQAAADGADLTGQLRKGMGSAALGYATERISNVAFAGLKAVKPGVADDFLEKGISAMAQKLASTPQGVKALETIGKLGVSFTGEFSEEFIEGFLDPYVTRLAYDPNAETVFQNPELLGDYLYEAMIGGILGGVGGGVNLAAQSMTAQEAAQEAEEADLDEDKRITPANPAQAVSQSSEALDVDNVLRDGALEIAQQETPAAPFADAVNRDNNVSDSRVEDAQLPIDARQNAHKGVDASRVEWMVQNGKAFGEAGKKAFSSAYDRKANPVEFYSDFARYYNAGMTGRKETVVKSEFDALEEWQRKMAYAAGKNDAASELEKQKQAAQAIKSSVGGLVDGNYNGGLPESERVILDTVGKRLGVSIVINGNMGADGMTFIGERGVEVHISPYLDEEPAQFRERAFSVVRRHEITHSLQRLAPEAYKRFRDYAMQFAGEGAIEEKRAQYARRGQTLSNERAMDEIVADFAGQTLTDEQTIQRVIKEDRTLAQKIRDAVLDLAQRFKEAIGMADPTLERATKLWNDAFRAAESQRQDGNKKTAQVDGEVQYSIRETANGKKYVDVDIDQELFDGLSTAEMQTVAKRVIVDRFKGKVIGTDYTAYVTKPSAEHYAYPANRRMDEQQKRDKMRASTELDHLIEVSVFRENVPDDGRHPVATGGIDKLDTSFMVNGRMYDAEVSVLVTDRGRVFYDITKFKDTVEREVGQTQNRAAETSNDVFNSSISHIEHDDNSQFSISETAEPVADRMKTLENDLRNQLGRSVRPVKKQEEIRKAAQNWIEEYGTTQSTENIANRLGDLYSRMTTVSNLQYEPLMEEAVSIAEEIFGKGDFVAEYSADMNTASQLLAGELLEWYFDTPGHPKNLQIDRIRRVNRKQIKRTVTQMHLADMSERYGSIPDGEKPYRSVEIPRRSSADEMVSQTVRTILEAEATPDEVIPSIEEMVANGDFSYDVYTDKQAMADAESNIRKSGWEKSQREWFGKMEKGEVSKELTTRGWVLYNNAANTGDTELALDILDAMVKHQRNAAQALQATRVLKKLSPETQLYQIRRSVEGLQEELNQRYGEKNGPELQINKDLAEQYMKAQTEEERDEIMKDIYRDIGRHMPSRFADKWNAWRYLAMLGNLRTHVRNVFGNLGFAPVVGAKNMTAAAIESAVSRVSGGKLERTKGVVGLSKADRGLLSAAWKDYALVDEAAMSGGKYDDLAHANKYIEEGRVIFKNKALEAARKGNSKALEAEDRWFSQPHYAAALAGYCKTHGITAEQIASGKGLKNARAYALKEAQKATYRDTNALSQTISELGRVRKDEKNSVKKGLGMVMEGILPFRKTPANILARGLEYSPIGLMNGIKQALFDVKSKKKTGAEAIDSISAGLTGTGLLALGIYMAAQGLVRGHGSGDEKEKEYEELMGHQAYALELPDGTSVTLDWLAPEVLPFFIGVNLWEQTEGEAEELTLSAMLNAVKTVSEPLLEMSCLQSLNDVFDSVGYAASEGLDGLPAALASAATSYLTQGLPTILGQAERTGEGQRMTTYTEKNAFLTGDMQYTLGKASARLPGWDYQQIPYIDAWGRTESSGGVGERAFSNFLNPAYTSTVDARDMEKELLRLYEATGEGGVLPSRAAKYFNVDNERKDLTGEEYVKYATKKGQTAYDLMAGLTKSSAYKAMDDAEKVEAVKKVYEYANAVGKAAVSSYKPDGWVAKAIKTSKATGVKAEQYVTLYLAQKSIESLKDADGETIDNSKSLLIMQMLYNTKGLTEKQRLALFEDFGVGKKVQHYNRTLVDQKLAAMKKQAK